MIKKKINRIRRFFAKQNDNIFLFVWDSLGIDVCLLVLVWLVWCVRQSIGAPSGPSNHAISLSPPFGRGWAHIPQCEPGPSPGAAQGAHKIWPRWPHATIHLLWQDPNLDRIRFLGIRGSNIPGRFFCPGNGDAGEDLPKLVQASRLHRLPI